MSKENMDIHAGGFSLFMDEFVDESDRSAVILGAAKMESLLGSILDKHLLPSISSNDDLLEGDSPLGTFSSRIKICNRLGLIDNHFTKLLHIFRRLRNGFAHEITTGSLSTGSARDRVCAMADPFSDSDFFQRLAIKVAKSMDRSLDDTGVLFRVTLSIFYLELESIRDAISCCGVMFDESIVEKAQLAHTPDGQTESKVEE